MASALQVIDKGVVCDKHKALIAGNCRCKNGDLLVAFNTGGDLSAGQRIGIVRSSDCGRTWGEPEIFFESIFNRGGIETGCTLTSLSGGRLLLSYADGFYLHPGTNNYERSAILFCLVSDDNGATWQNAKAQCLGGLEYFPFGPIVELHDGTLLLPVWGVHDRRKICTPDSLSYGGGLYASEHINYLMREVWSPGLLKSEDGGESWGEWHSITQRGNETPIILLPDGRAMALIRGYTDDKEHPFHVAYSEDGGDSWTAPQRVNINGTSPALHITPKGKLLAGYRSTLQGGRCHISSSRDCGLTWKFNLELELPHGTWDYGGYPAFVNLPDGHILVSFHNAVPSWYVAFNILSEE